MNDRQVGSLWMLNIFWEIGLWRESKYASKQTNFDSCSKTSVVSQIWFILKLFAENNQNMCILGLALVFFRRNTYFIALETIAISSFSCSNLHLVLFRVFSLTKKFHYFVSRKTRFMLFVFLDKTLALVIIECSYWSFVVKKLKFIIQGVIWFVPWKLCFMV